MDDREVYSKTEAGREEMRTRALQLPGALRNVLLLVDGNRTVGQLKELLVGGKASPDALDQLVTLGLIEMTDSGQRIFKTPEVAAPASAAPAADEPPAPMAPIAPAPMPLMEPRAPVADSPSAEANESRAKFDRLYTLMNEIVSDYLGLRGYFMQLKIERCANSEDLLALQDELGAALNKAHGKDVAAELMARIASAAR